MTDSTILICRTTPDGAGLIVTKEPVECKFCRVMHAFFINRDGRTRCVDCDREGTNGKR